MHQYSGIFNPLGGRGGVFGVSVVGVGGEDRAGDAAEGNDNTNNNILSEGLDFLQ